MERLNKVMLKLKSKGGIMYKVYKKDAEGLQYLGSRFTIKSCNEIIDTYVDYFKKVAPYKRIYVIKKNGTTVKELKV